jgi:hypothetical protein
MKQAAMGTGAVVTLTVMALASYALAVSTLLVPSYYYDTGRKALVVMVLTSKAQYVNALAKV